MHLLVGGAYAGKRKVIREMYPTTSWHSAYEQKHMLDWEQTWKLGTALVLEGWEKWIEERVQLGKNIDTVRNDIKRMLEACVQVQNRRRELGGDDRLVVSMLEMGRGIVPLNKEERMVRDLNGWVTQDIAQHAEKVMYVWHGLTQTIQEGKG